VKFLLLNQTFYPDVVSTAQHLADLAVGLVERGHDVTVVASRRAYDDPAKGFSAKEVWRGVKIVRVGSTGLGKAAKWKRAIDFGSFMLNCVLRLIFLPRADAVVALTSPPLISLFGAILARMRGSQFYYWVMDFNPDEAIAAGWLRPGSFSARLLDRMSRYSLQSATKIIALDRYMAERIERKGIPKDKIATIPPWAHDTEVNFDPEGRRRFREANGFGDKFVVMYSGNHSPCHPLTTLLDVAKKLRNEDSILFAFIGGGSEFRRVKDFARQENLTNIKALPYQPLNGLAGSLSSADLHVVVMGDPFVGLVHPCKIYNVLSVGAPILYIGPEPGHIPDILKNLNGHVSYARAAHDDVDALLDAIKKVRANGTRNPMNAGFGKERLLPQLMRQLEGEHGRSKVQPPSSRK
jgi:putative colanic acid biosynthesis glycosyltransferase WcaI